MKINNTKERKDTWISFSFETPTRNPWLCRNWNRQYTNLPKERKSSLQEESEEGTTNWIPKNHAEWVNPCEPYCIWRTPWPQKYGLQMANSMLLQVWSRNMVYGWIISLYCKYEVKKWLMDGYLHYICLWSWAYFQHYAYVNQYVISQEKLSGSSHSLFK